MNLLGIWDGHDSGAALLQEGRVQFAVNEERLTRRKLEVCFPARSIAACLAHARLAPSDVHVVAASTSDPRWTGTSPPDSPTKRSEPGTSSPSETTGRLNRSARSIRRTAFR